MTQNFLDLEIHTLICNRDLLLAINNFKSLQKFEEFKNIPVFLHDDGSLSDFDIKSLSGINNVTVIRRAEADKAIYEYLKDYKNCLEYRLGDNKINLWHKIKSFDYFFFSKTKKVLGIDTDLLFLRKPEDVIKYINSNTPFYFPDIQSAYCFNEPKGSVPVIDKVNTGLIFIPSEEYYHLTAIENALGNLLKEGINYFPSWIEQSAFAHMFYIDGRYLSLDIQKYRIPFFQSIEIEEVECLHFVSYPAVRDTYKEYVDYLQFEKEELVYQSSNIVEFREEKVPLTFDIFKGNNTYRLEYYWGLEKTQQQSLDHIFKIKTLETESLKAFQSSKNGFFILPFDSGTIGISHTYDWYGEQNWIDLGEVVLK